MIALKPFSLGDSSWKCTHGRVPGRQAPTCDNEQGTEGKKTKNKKTNKKTLKGIEEKEPIKLIFFLTGLPLKSMCVMVS